MPDVICIGCGSTIYLEETTYANYQGEVTCIDCKTPHSILIEKGALRTNSSSPGAYDNILDILAHEVPQDILYDLGEAARDIPVASYKSCVVMCGRALQGSLLDKGLKDQDLDKMIDDARNKGVLTEEHHQQAKAVRFFRNTGAHPKNPALRVVTELQAILALQIAKEILQYIYPLRQLASQPGTDSNAK